jgi:hypothetical protein
MVFAAAVLVVLALVAADYFLDLGLFGRGARGILILVIGMVFVWGARFAPAPRDWQEYRIDREARKAAKDQ